METLRRRSNSQPTGCALAVGIKYSEIWPILNQLRQRKNDIFEAAITNEVRRMIQ